MKFLCFREIDGVRNGARLEPKKIAKAPEGEGCPRCGGYVYAAEQMLARGRVSVSLCTFGSMYIFGPFLYICT